MAKICGKTSGGTKFCTVRSGNSSVVRFCPRGMTNQQCISYHKDMLDM